MTINEDDLFRVLQYINAVRQRCGLSLLTEIPRGISPNDRKNEPGRSCPIARAIPGVWVSNTYVLTSSRQLAEILSTIFEQPLKHHHELHGGFLVRLPGVLIEFIDRYENHLLPQLIEEP